MERFKFLVFFVFLLVVVLRTGHCIDCYSCSTKNSTSCLDPEKNNLKKRHCNYEALKETQKFATDVYHKFMNVFEVHLHTNEEPAPLNCLKIVNKVQHEEIIIRGCQLEETNALNLCSKVKQEANNYVKIHYCSLCGDTDGCNSSTFVDSVPLLTLFLSTLLLMKVFTC